MIDCQVRQSLTLFSSSHVASGFSLTNIVSFITLKWISDFSLNILVAPLSCCTPKTTKYALRCGIGVTGFCEAYRDCPVQNLPKSDYLGEGAKFAPSWGISRKKRDGSQFSPSEKLFARPSTHGSIPTPCVLYHVLGSPERQMLLAGRPWTIQWEVKACNRFSRLRLVQGVIQALHLEYGSTQSMVVLITDTTVPRGFLLIQARARVSSGRSLIWAPWATSLWMLALRQGHSPVRMEGDTAAQRGQATRHRHTQNSQIFFLLPSLWGCGLPQQGDFPEMPQNNACPLDVSDESSLLRGVHLKSGCPSRRSFSFSFSPVWYSSHSSVQNMGRAHRGGNEVIVLVHVTKSRGLESSLECVALSLPVDFLCLLHE